MTDLVPIETPRLLAAIGEAAMNPAVDVGKMQQLLDMHRQMQAHQAEQEFARAMNSAQSEMTVIGVDAYNPQTKSKYAKYEKLDRALRPIYVRHGFSLSFDTLESEAEGIVRCVCYVSHIAGHT